MDIVNKKIRSCNEYMHWTEVNQKIRVYIILNALYSGFADCFVYFTIYAYFSEFASCKRCRFDI